MALSTLHSHSLALLTDLYQLTMAFAYWRSGRSHDEAVFHVSFRNNPFRGGYAIACGLAHVVQMLHGCRPSADDIAYLGTLTDSRGGPLFSAEFLSYLASLELACDVHAVREGTPVFALEPLLRIRGPLIQCQILESALLNILNFQTLIATKAARVCHAAEGEPVLEFGLRRAQGVDGAVAASRAAHIGGCSATSNVLAGKLYGIPVRGTHAHSWVMTFDDETDSFAAYASAMPNNCVFLVDTYDTLRGVKRAIDVGRQLRAKGHSLLGIRLDSGDLARLSIEARRLLDEAGFHDAVIVASNDLDEHVVQRLKQQDAQIAVWGVGTRLVTAYDQPALGGVCKLSSVRSSGGPWRHKVKVSDDQEKTSIPGHLQVRRYSVNSDHVADIIYDEGLGLQTPVLVDLDNATDRREVPGNAACHDLLEPVFERGRFVGTEESLETIRERCATELNRLQADVKRIDNPRAYPVGLEPRLHEMRRKMLLSLKSCTSQRNADGP